jgi:PIN domain nuclease of toxin-antitoxin system
MEYLLDTHTLIWAATDPSRLSRRAATIISDKKNEIYISAASAWEIATKVRKGKLPEAILLEGDFERIVQQAKYRLLPITVPVALRAGRLIGTLKDPFDRVIAAQSLHMDIPLLGVDEEMDNFGIRRIW